MSTRQAQRMKRTYGGPFIGLVDSVDLHEAPLGAFGADSREMLLEPGRVPGLAKAKRRHGAAGYGSATGVLEMPVAQATMRGLEAFELPTTVSGDGYPVFAALWADESRRFAQVALHDGSTDYTEGEEFGSTHYPTAASTQGNIKMPPIPYDGNGATGYTRGAFEENRRRLVAGTRKRVGIKAREFFGGYLSAPTNWDRSYNLSSVAGSNNLVHYPTGHIMPLWAPTHPAGQYPTLSATAQAWMQGDTYFEAWAFEWEDGSVSMPFIPRDKQGVGATLPNGIGLVTVNDTGAGQWYAYVPDRDIPIGPPGVKKRRKYRSNKVTKAQIAAGSWPDISTLKLCAIIEDNTSTSYNDPRGNDGALFTDPLLRTDQVWPDCGRYDWSFDHRHGTGYLRPNPYALVVAPTATPGGTSRGINAGYDDVSLVGATAFLVQVRQDAAGAKTLRLRATAFGAAVPTNNSFALAAGTTLQSLCDQINATTTVAATYPGGEWVAQIVPGANANVDVTNLAPSHIDAPGCSWLNNSPTLNVGSGTYIAEGMKVNDAQWPAGTYVKSKAGNVLTMSANSTGATAGPADVEFYADTGDDALFTDATAHSQYGNMRAYGNAIPVVLAFTRAYLDSFPVQKRDFMVTTGGPSQKPNAAHMFHTSPGGRYSAESEAGIFMGAAPLHAGCVVFYSNRIGWYRNQRAGTTAEDADYRMDWVEFSHGCRSPYSIVYGNNWVGCWTDAGYWVFDGNGAAIITGNVYDPNTLKGSLAYEANLCNAAAAADTNDYYMQAHYRDGRLWLNFRTDATHWATLCYDCSVSIEASGLAQVMNADGQPYGWSSRLRYSWRSGSAGCGGAITSVRKSDGIHLYQCDDKNDKTNCGLVQEFETTGAYLDGADPVQWQLWTTKDMAGGMKKFSLADLITILYRYTLSSSTAQVLVVVYRDQQRASAASSFLLNPTTGTAFARKVLNPQLKARSPGEVVEFFLSGGSAAQEQIAEFSLIDTTVEVLDSLT